MIHTFVLPKQHIFNKFATCTCTYIHSQTHTNKHTHTHTPTHTHTHAVSGALSTYEQALSLGIEPDSHILNSLLLACARAKNSATALRVYTQSEELLRTNEVSLSSVLCALSSGHSSDLEAALAIVQRAEEHWRCACAYSCMCVRVRVYVCVYVCVYMYIYIYIVIWKRLLILYELHVCIYVCVHIYIYIYIYICMYVCMY